MKFRGPALGPLPEPQMPKVCRIMAFGTFLGVLDYFTHLVLVRRVVGLGTGSGACEQEVGEWGGSGSFQRLIVTMRGFRVWGLGFYGFRV